MPPGTFFNLKFYLLISTQYFLNLAVLFFVIIFNMERKMLNSNLFTKWLDHKADLIASKVDREQITTEEMIVLSLQNMDLTYRLEFSKIEKQFKEVDKRFEEVHKKFDDVDKRFEQVDKRFEQVDKRFDRLERLGTWAFALLFTGIVGILLKLK